MTMTDIETARQHARPEDGHAEAAVPLSIEPELGTDVILFDPDMLTVPLGHSVSLFEIDDHIVDADPFNRVKAVDTAMGFLALRDTHDMDGDVQRWIVDVRGQIERQDTTLPPGVTVTQYLADLVQGAVPDAVRESILLAAEERRDESSLTGDVMRLGRDLSNSEERHKETMKSLRKMTVNNAKSEAKLRQVADLLSDQPELQAQVQAIIDSRFVDPRFYDDPYPSEAPDESEERHDSRVLQFIRGATGALAKAIQYTRRNVS